MLPEVQLRWLWMGYRRNGIDSSHSKVGRDWPIAIGQVPDWSLDLDAKGQVIGRLETELESV